MKKIFITLFCILFSHFAFAQNFPANAKKPNEFAKAPLRIGMYQIQVSVARNRTDQNQGLMYRTHLDENEGMLFVYQENAFHCFWMKNTLIPLSIAFIDRKGIITDITEMQAKSLKNHCPSKMITYALEMNRNWFSQRDIKPGMQVHGIID